MALEIILFISVIILLLLIISFFIFYKFYFLRNPKRKIPAGNNIVSPADGRIVKIMKISNKDTINGKVNGKGLISIDKGIFGRIKTIIADVDKECYLIQIMLTPFDVHYQRAPIDGKVTLVSYTTGKFQNAVKDASSLRCFKNEKNEMLFTQKDKKLKIKVIQIAGALARRIVCFVKIGDELKKGQHIGLIKLGSQVSLIIPSKCTLHIKENDYVYGGSTIIADKKQ